MKEVKEKYDIDLSKKEYVSDYDKKFIELKKKIKFNVIFLDKYFKSDVYKYFYNEKEIIDMKNKYIED